MNAQHTWIVPISRGELLDRAKACGWPRVEYLGRPIAGEAEWVSCPLRLASDRRTLFERLDALERRG